MSEHINLNDANFDVSDSAVFNKGKAGKVENVSLRVEPKDPNDTTNSPSWKLFFIDPDDNEINQGFYYLDETHEKFKTHLKYQGASLKHLLHAAFGADFQIPNFANAKEMLDKCMKQLSTVPKEKKFRVAVSYGTDLRPSLYLRMKPYPTFIEPMSVPAEETKIVFAGGYLMERPTADDDEETVEEFKTTSEPVDQEPEADMSGFTAESTVDSSEDSGEKDDLPF